MKKRLTLIMLVVLCFLSILVVNTSKKVEAKDNFSTSQYKTQIIGIGGKLVNSSTAYEGVYIFNPGVNNPSDIFIDENDLVYLADKDNGRIVIYNHTTKETREIGKGILTGPTGVTVSNNGDIYVADGSNSDNSKKAVYIFNQDGENILKITRPREPLFGIETITSIPTALLSGSGAIVELRGKVKSIDDDKMSITLEDEEGNVIQAYHLATEVKVDDNVVVSGTITSYEGVLKIAEGATAKIVKEGEISSSNQTSASYIPTKVSVDSADNIYIISEGNANGIIQIKLNKNEDGSFKTDNPETNKNESYDFLGYFGPNKSEVSLAKRFEYMFLTKEQKEASPLGVSRPTTNVTIDNRNTVYSVIEGEVGLSMKKFNVNGINILTGNAFYSKSYQDIWVDENGFIYTVDKEMDATEGAISVIDPEGNLLFKFGNTMTGANSLGQFQEASGIAVDSKGNIWVTDSRTNSIQVFMRTQYANTVMNALLNYNEGNYSRAVTLYNEVLEMNSSFVQAYDGLGKIAQRNQQYEEALDYFRIAEYKSGYSEVFWELRDDWLSKNLLWVFGLVIALLMLKIFHVYGKAYDKFMPIKGKEVVKKAKGSKLMGELKYLVHILKHPYDTFYDIKFGQKIRFKTALGIFVFFIVMNIFCDYFLTGYLFRPGNVNNFNLGFELLKWGLIIVLFVISNYLISSLQNGEGFFRDIFIATIYCFAPLILFKIPLSIVTNVLSYNEQYLVTLANLVLWGVSILYVILMIRDVHNYKLGALFLNIILTFVAMIVMVLIYLMVYILSMQLFEFIFGLLEEAVYIYG